MAHAAAVTRREAAYPLSDRTSLGALALSARVHHLLDPDGVTFLSVPAPEEKQFSDFDGQSVCSDGIPREADFFS